MNAHSVERTAMTCMLTLMPVTLVAHWSGAGVLAGWCVAAMLGLAAVGVAAVSGRPCRGPGPIGAPPAVPAASITDADIHAWLTQEAP